MIFIAGISIALLLSALLLAKKEKSSSDNILFWWMLLNAIHLMFFYSLYNESIYQYPILLGIQFPLPLLHGVFLYFYVSTVTQQLTPSKSVRILHFIPAILTLIYLIPFFNLPSQNKIDIFKSGGKGYETFQTVIMYAVFLSGIVYVFWSLAILRNHKKRIRNHFSNIEQINLKWLKFLTYGIGMIWSLVIFIQNDIIIFIGVSIFVILIGFFGLQQQNIFGIINPTDLTPNDEESVELPKNLPPSKVKYGSSGLKQEKEDECYILLAKLIEEEKVFKNPNLSLNDLASKLVIHPNYLSQIINKRVGKTFYDYINWYRVEEFKHLITIPSNQQFTLISLAYDCGFNSKSSFNRYFKKIAGLTPTQYSKTILNPKE